MYPVTYEADIPVEGRNRLSTLLRYIYGIPSIIVAFFFILAAEVVAFIAWFAIVFTGRYPEGLYNFNVKALRMVTRTNSFLNLAVDEMPPLSGDDEPGYPVRLGVAEPLGKYSRAKTFFRLIVGIPVWICNYIWQIIAAVVSFIAWFAILFTGKMPEGLVKPLHGSLAYQSKALAYALLLTEDWPPFSEAGDVVPAGQIPTRTQTDA
jgi:hypothetical protein